MRFNVLIIFFVIILSGCQTIEQSRQTEARRQVEQRYLDERTNRLQGDVNVLREEFIVLQEEVASLQETLNEIRRLALVIYCYDPFYDTKVSYLALLHPLPM